MNMKSSQFNARHMYHQSSNRARAFPRPAALVDQVVTYSLHNLVLRDTLVRQAVLSAANPRDWRAFCAFRGGVVVPKPGPWCKRVRSRGGRVSRLGLHCTYWAPEVRDP